MEFLTLWKHLALLWISVRLSDSSSASDSSLPILDEKKVMHESMNDAKILGNSTAGDLPVNMTTTVSPVQNAHTQTVISDTQTGINGTTNGNRTSNDTMPKSDDARSAVTTVLTSTMKTITAMHTTATTLHSSFNGSLPTTAQPDTFHSSTSDLTTTNDTIVSDVVNTDSSGTDAYPLTPAILAAIAVVATILFFVILYAIFKLVQSFTAVRFRRLHEMPMDDFDDFPGVYAEHTVPFQA